MRSGARFVGIAGARALVVERRMKSESRIGQRKMAQMQAGFRSIFERSFTTMDDYFEGVLVPIFGRAHFVAGCDDYVEKYADLGRRARGNRVVAMRHVGTFGVGGRDLKVFEVVVDDRANIRRDRVGIQSVVRSFSDVYDRAWMVIHYENPQGRSWRFSYVEKHGSAKETTSIKRYTYLCGPGYGVRTAAQRLAKLAALKDMRIDDTAEAFSVQAVTKEFYTKLYRWYEWAQDESFNVTFPSVPATIEDDPATIEDGRSRLNEHLIRLITRIAFVWFIKQKHFVADELFDGELLGRDIKDFDPMAGKDGEGCKPQCESATNYYHAILQNLFFATINMAMDGRRFANDDDDSKTLYRYEELFTDEGRGRILNCFAQTPFLNGGLFECLDESEAKSNGDCRVDPSHICDGFSRRDDRRGDTFVYRAFIPNILFFSEDEQCPGMITLLKQYDFAVEESTADDIAVALDPELLGKVFENLLASYNPETHNTARRATGSFYTPREIVRYMIETSIGDYIKMQIAQNKSLDIAPEVVDRLIKGDACPAELTENKEVIRQILFDTKILDPACGSGAFPMGALQCMIEILHKLRPDADGKDVYMLKKRMIENCLYGVDIQTMAVQITKLRCYISLIVEAEVDPSQPNLGIDPPPNLETRFVAANALVPLDIKANRQPSDVDLAVQEMNREKIHLNCIRQAHFHATTREEKMRLRREDRSVRERLAKLWRDNGLVARTNIDRFVNWHPYEQNASCDFFDPEWMFDVRDGFDIVVGNPPYGAKMSKSEKSLYKKAYNWLFKKYDIYMVFFELAFRLSKGIICYITPDKWLSKSFGIVFRREAMIPYMTQIVRLGSDVFDEACVDAIISIYHKKGSKELSIVKAISHDEYRLANAIEKADLKEPYCIDEYFQGELPAIIEQIERNVHRLGEYAKCEYASASPADAYRLKQIMMSNGDPTERQLKIINTGLISKYTNRWDRKKMKYLHESIEHPVVDIDDLSAMFGEVYVNRMRTPKLILKGLNLLECAIDFDGTIMSTVATLNIRSDSAEMLCVLGSIINSSVMTEYCKSKYISSSYCGGLLFTPDMINRLPVPDLSDMGQWRDVVERVLCLMSEGGDRAIEAELDAMIRCRLLAE